MKILRTWFAAATFKDGLVGYTVEQERHGLRFPIHDSGRLEGDTITGKIDRPVPGGDREQVEGKARRSK